MSFPAVGGSTGNGEMRAYIGDGKADFNDTKSMRVPGDWNTYNALVAPGAETSGGKLELLARDDAGRLWLYLATGHGQFERPDYRRRLDGNGRGGFGRRVLLGKYWNRYEGLF